MTKRSGAALIINNREPAGLGDIADPLLHHDISVTRAPFISA